VRPGTRILHRSEREDHILGTHRLAVVPPGLGRYRERDLQRVGAPLPGVGKRWRKSRVPDGVELRPKIREALEDQVRNLSRVAPVRIYRLKRRRLGGRRDDERPSSRTLVLHARAIGWRDVPTARDEQREW